MIEHRTAEDPTHGATQRTYEEQIPKLYAALNQILSNLRYIRDELPNEKTTDDTRTALLKLCDDFEWEVLDIRMEVRTLEDNLGMHVGEEPFDHGMGSADPKETMGFIHDWLAAQLATMHDLIIELRAHTEGDLHAARLSILVEESAANIIPRSHRDPRYTRRYRRHP